MADRGDTHYFVPNLNVWFAVSSVLFLIATFWMVIDDWNAPWKKYQRQFREIELARAEAALETDDAKAVFEREAALQANVDRITKDLESQSGAIAEAEEALFQAKGKLWKLTEEAKAIKEAYNWDKSQIEHHRQHENDPTLEEKPFRAISTDLEVASAKKETAEIEFKAREAELAALLESRTIAENDLKQAGKSLELIRKKKDTLDPEDAPTQVANIIRDFPGMDFIGPNLKVKKNVLDKLTFELNFTKKTRIDMCTTCHEASDRHGFTEEELKHPHRSHPRLDLFLTAKSPHPMKDFGCTICHRGSGEALDFQRADHYPSNEEEGHAWHDEYHWHKQHHWDYPMLSSEYVEASCIQCHKDSMELIADDAPKLTEGYRLIERYGCYSCHTIDWFPTKRKPGPSLKNIQAKITPDFMGSWIANPKAFRPTTWMPQIFHLENFAPDEVISARPQMDENGEAVLDGEGQPVMVEYKGEEWNNNAIAAIVAFINDKAPENAYPPIPVEGDPERGREVMRVVGCYACHNIAPWEEDPNQTNDPAMEPGRYNQHGPNLRGVATKIKAEWLFAWVKNPHDYWADTNMPDLRIDDQDAADITSYIMEDPDGIFSDVPEGWATADVPYDLDVLQEQARWHFSRDGRATLKNRFEGKDPAYRWDRAEDLLVAVGEKWVLAQGCYSCHEIEGLEEAMPIGTELSNWASKTVDKLDWGAMADILQKEHGWDINTREEFKHYRENWLTQKLHEPRSFDRQKIKNPMEKLKMPYFGFTDDQVKAITTFVVGLVDDEVQMAKMVPTANQASMDVGLRTIRQKNCVACHMVDPGTITFKDEAGEVHTIFGEPLAIGDDSMPPYATDTAMFEAAITRYEEDNEEEIEELGFRVLEPAPGIQVPGQPIFIPRENFVSMTPPWGGDFVRVVTDYYYYGIEMYDAEAEDPDEAFYPWSLDPDGGVQDVDGEFRQYYEEPYDKVRLTFAPPVLYDEGYKLQRDWFYAFLKDPVALRKQIRTKMPTFHYRDGEAEGVADYFANIAKERWPSKYARAMRLSMGLDLKKDTPTRHYPSVVANSEGDGGKGISVAQVAEGTGLSEDVVRAIERGSKPETVANFSKIFDWGTANGFVMNGAVDPAYERIERRSPTHLAQRHAMIGQGAEIADQAVNCFQCHFAGGQDPEQVATPIAWAPDLDFVRERLREDWMEDWLLNPGLIYPGTAMPANFTAEPPQYQDVYPESSNMDQIQAVLDYLFNFERASSASD